MKAITQLYDVNRAAQMLAVSTWTVRAYIHQGRLRAVRIGRLVRLEVQELERFIASLKSAGESAATSNIEEENDVNNA